jgi:hypothetical protein
MAKLEHYMSARTPYDYGNSEDLAALELTHTRVLKVQRLPAKSPQFEDGLNIRKHLISTGKHTTEGMTIALSQIDIVIDALIQARERLQASGRLERPGDDSMPATAARKARSDPEKRSDVLRLAADGLTVREIESETGVSRSTVARWIAEEAETSSATAE